MKRLGILFAALVSVLLLSAAVPQKSTANSGTQTLYGTFEGGGVVEVRIDPITPRVSLLANISRPRAGQLAICWIDQFGRSCFAPPNGQFGKENCVKFSKTPFAIPANATVEVVDENLNTTCSTVLSANVPRGVHKLDRCR